jgi:hypothetical protein
MEHNRALVVTGELRKIKARGKTSGRRGSVRVKRSGGLCNLAIARGDGLEVFTVTSGGMKYAVEKNYPAL